MNTVWRGHFTYLVAAVITVAALFLSGCQQSNPEVDERVTSDREVYAVLIGEITSKSNAQIQWVIVDQTYLEPTTLGAMKPDDLQDASDEAWQDLIVQNAEPESLRGRINAAYDFISQQQLDSLAETQDGWVDFYKSHTAMSGIVGVSQIGYNTAMDQALVYGATTCGVTCGMGNLYWFRKEDGAWTWVGTHMVWIS